MKKSMRKGIAYVLSIAIAMSGLVMPAYETKDVEAATSYQLVWSDEFDGTALDTATWNVEVNGDGGGNNELQYYVNDADNISVNNGTLKITALKEDYNGKAYTSGRINTMRKKTFKYGRVEARMKLPSFTGSWPAFWMMGNNYQSVGWPACGEIDIMEAVNAESTIYGTGHWETFAGTGTEGSAGGSINGVDRTAWHTYAIEWTESKIDWYMDNTKYYTLNITDQMTEFQAEQFIIFNLAVGGTWPGYSVDNTAFPNASTMEVDYVRVYQEKEVADMTYETATRNDAFNPYGNWTVYVASSWANSTAEVAVDPVDGDHIKIKPLTSDWSASWSLQTRYTMTGLTPGETYHLAVDMISGSTDGAFQTDAKEGSNVPLAIGTTTITRTAVADANGELYITFGLGWIGLGVEVEFANVRCYANGEAPTEETTAPSADTMTFETATKDSTFHPYGNWNVLVASTWGASSADVAVDPTDADHIKLKPTASDWSDAWALQAQYVKSGLTPGETYVLIADLKASSTDGTYLTDAVTSTDPIALSTSTTHVRRTAVADEEGKIALTFGFGWVGINVILELKNVECYLEGEAPTEPPTKADVDWEYEAATKDDNFHAYGNWTLYVASSWGGSSANVAVDPANANRIKVVPTASDWSAAWAVQARYTMSGLTPGAKYALSVDMKSDTMDGSYLTDAVAGETPIALSTDREVITIIAAADAEGKVAITFGLGWVGLNNGVEFDFVSCVSADEIETTTPQPEAGFSSVTKDEKYNPYGNWELYLASTWGGSTAEVAVDALDADHIMLKPTASDWSAAWTLQARYKVEGLQPGATYDLSVDLFGKTDDGGYLTDAIAQEESIPLTTEATTVTRTCVADADGTIAITFGFGWVGIGNVVDLSNVRYEFVAEPVAPELVFAGFQISTTQGGSRALYMIDESKSTLDIESFGLLYGLASETNENQITLDEAEENQYVVAFEGTEKGLCSADGGISTYVMTMKMNIGETSVEGLNAVYYVRTYAKLSNGAIVYGDVTTYSLYEIADVLYQGQSMPTEAGHNYLYENILYPVDNNYVVVDFKAENTVV